MLNIQAWEHFFATNTYAQKTISRLYLAKTECSYLLLWDLPSILAFLYYLNGLCLILGNEVLTVIQSGQHCWVEEDKVDLQAVPLSQLSESVSEKAEGDYAFYLE